MELVRSASSEGESSPSIGNTRRKRKPTATQSSGQYTKRPKTLPVVTTVPLRKSARLIARQLRIADEEKAKAAAAAAEEARNKRGSSSGSAESSTSRSGGGKKSRETPSSSSSASIEEVSKSSSESKSDTRTQGKAPKARVGSSRKRKRSNSPRYKPSTTHSKTKECSSPAPPLRRSSRNSAVSDRLQSAERDTPTISGTGGDPKHKNPAKRQRTNRSNKSAPTAASGSSCAKNQQTAGSKVEKTETGEIHSPVANTTSQVSAKDSGASLPGTTNKGKRREKSRKVPTVPIGESVEGQAKRFTRRKEAGKDAGKESVVAEGEFDRHGRRVTGKSVICEPQKGKSARSVKGKGRARTEIPRQSSGSTRISIPSFIEFGTLGMSDASSDKATASGGGGEKGGGGKGTEAGKKEGGDGASNSSSDSTLAASMSEDNHRLQSMLEAQGLPPHLLGALGSKMQYILHKSFSSMSSSNSSRAHQLLTDMESGDESTQLQACIEVGQLLVMGNEETLGGFPVKQAVPILSNLLSLEHNFDMMVQACRALSYMMDALPRSSAVVAKTIPLLVKKLQVIQCMDVAEQALSALELLSRRHGKDILQAGGLNASLAYLDFFSLTTQRRALSVTANCCYSLAEEDFPLVVDSVPILTARLQHQDKKSVESCCQCFSRVVESFSSNQTILRQIVTTALLQNLQQLLVVSPPAISSGTFVTVLRMLSTLCSACPPLAVELLTINIADTLRYLLAGSGEITLDNIELMSRSPNEVYEILSLTGHLMPPLPRDGIFEIEAIISTKKHAPSVVQWEWQENEGSWRAYNSLDNRNIEMAHLAHEEECNISVMGRDYTIDLGTMQQINEDTGTTRSVRRKILDRAKSTTEQQSTMDTDARAVALNSDPALGSSFVKALFAVLYELFNSMAGSSVHNKCLKTILRVLYHSDSEVLEDILRDIPVSSHIATMLKSKDSHTIVGGVQMAHILMEKLPSIFLVLFHREGVVHEVRALRDSPLRLLPTPRKDTGRSPGDPAPPGPPSLPPPRGGRGLSSVAVGAGLASATPPGSSYSSTRKRLSDILRRGKRHFRRSLTRARSEDEHPSPHVPLTPKVPLEPPTSTPPKPIPPRSSSFSLSSATDHHPLATPPAPQGSKFSTNEGTSSNSPGAGFAGSSSGSGGSVKEKVNTWIHCQLESFLEKWVPPDQTHPALDAVRRLTTSVERLSLSSSDYLDSLKTVSSILLDAETNISSFEIMHSGLVPSLTSFLTVETPESVVALNSRLKAFVHVFIGIPEQDTSLANWTPPTHIGLVPLLQKLHGCVGQLEQFSVRVNDMPGRRGSQALKFFNSHQIKCSLEKHSTAPSSVSNWKGGPLRIDPLATLQTLERYLVVRGIGMSDQAAKRLEDIEFGDEVEENMIVAHMPTTDRHYLEFLISDQVVPYNMTIFQAVRQFAVSQAQEFEDEAMPLGRPEIWIRTHTIHYRPVVPPPGAGSSKVMSTSLPSSTHLATSTASASPAPKKSSSSGSGRKRTSSAKTPLSVPTLFPRVTRSSSRDKSGSGAQPSPPLRPFRSPSLPTPPLPTKAPPAPNPPPTTKSPERVASKKSPSVGPASKEKQRRYGGGLSPLHQALKQSTELSLSSEDPSLPLLRLLKILYSINNHWTDLYQGVAGNPVVPMSEFVNSKLTSKANRQMQDPLNVMTGSFPPWLKDLAKHFPFLFPFECRQTLFYITTFDRDRAIARLQEQRPELTTAESSSQTVSPKFSKKKRCVARASLLEQGEKIINELASNRAMLEIHYEDEVGTGLGPTLEFYTLMSREFQRADLSMWRGELCPPLPGDPPGAASTPLYVHSPVGLFPSPLGPSASYPKVEEICSKFKFLGKFIAKAVMDSRMLDVPLSDAFYKWMLGQQGMFTAQDLQHVDPVVARSFAQLAAVAVNKHKLESDPLLSDKALSMGIEALSLDGGGSIDDLDLDFTLPGYPDIELKPGGKDVAVNIHNLDEYLKLVVDWTLVRGVARQVEAFKEGVASVLPLSSLHTFYPSEMDMLLCGANHQKWDVKELMDCCRPDHGYSHDSATVQNLFEVLSTYDTLEQRQFIQFVTGSPRLPVGGFKALNPPLTIVRKTVESPQNADDFLPSVMTCVNYLKLPNYSTVEVMREKLGFALREGKDCFHLS